MTSPTLYQYLLRLLPKHMRRNYGSEMTLVFTERLQERPGARPMLWIGETATLVRTGFRARVLDNLMLDLRAAARLYKRNPGFALLAFLMLSVGIGGATAMYSMLNAWVLDPLPYRDGSHLVLLETKDLKRGWTDNVSAADFADWQRDPSLEEATAWSTTGFNLTGSGDPERLLGARVGGNFFRLLGIAPALGRDFVGDDDQPGAQRTAILTHEYWQGRFLGDPSLLGKTIELDNEPATVVGILPEHFQFPLMGRANLFMPLALGVNERADRTTRWLAVLARRKSSVPPQRMQQSLDSLTRSLAEKYPGTNAGKGVYSTTLAEEIGRHQGNEVVVAVFGIMILVLLVVCSNIAGLMLAKPSMPSSSWPVRRAA
jgi:hypothetical protein